jgi:hypothetical protein
MSLENEVIVIFCQTQGYADNVPIERMREWETTLIRYMDASYPEIGRDIAEKKRITDETMERLRNVLSEFTASGPEERHAFRTRSPLTYPQREEHRSGDARLCRPSAPLRFAGRCRP